VRQFGPYLLYIEMKKKFTLVREDWEELTSCVLII